MKASLSVRHFSSMYCKERAAFASMVPTAYRSPSLYHSNRNAGLTHNGRLDDCYFVVVAVLYTGAFYEIPVFFSLFPQLSMLSDARWRLCCRAEDLLHHPFFSNYYHGPSLSGCPQLLFGSGCLGKYPHDYETNYREQTNEPSVLNTVSTTI